jgi:hypothetical protein
MPPDDLDGVIIIDHFLDLPEELILPLVELKRPLNLVDAAPFHASERSG